MVPGFDGVRLRREGNEGDGITVSTNELRSMGNCGQLVTT